MREAQPDEGSAAKRRCRAGPLTPNPSPARGEGNVENACVTQILCHTDKAIPPNLNDSGD
jgi:hypothetical protein